MFDCYAQRRARLMDKMQHGIAILPTAPEQRRNGDADYSYRFDSNFYYLSGFNEPESVLVLVAVLAEMVMAEVRIMVELVADLAAEAEAALVVMQILALVAEAAAEVIKVIMAVVYL